MADRVRFRDWEAKLFDCLLLLWSWLFGTEMNILWISRLLQSNWVGECTGAGGSTLTGSIQGWNYGKIVSTEISGHHFCEKSHAGDNFE